MKRIILFLILALALGFAACSNGEQQPLGGQAGQPAEKPDGSTVVVNTGQGGYRSEVRTFPAGEVARATRITKPDGTRRALVEFRDGRTVELNEKSDIDNLMDSSADSIKDRATASWEAIKSAGEKVGEKAAETGKEAGSEIGEKVKQGAEATKNAAADTAKAAGEGLKKAGEAVKKAGEKVKEKVKP